ncbi:two-component system nitrate/nitrite response regulator NarL [Pseudomonas frederiksbergensis]|jgi:two-component system nitrate/nitrite response regulator NarL|uniref:Two-component system nitrate/nitrite response regulator NarL n=1 Tax=Pseudomonas umsongensis TaxID=198618 RepID=A0ACC5MCZ5_9PSED|nr:MULTISPECIES: two-component system response regulator NarL [Pseudomonas]MBB2886549.1 two-component system nitrate/nitrite response regulator NarL [Pseudomonas umsongensis]MBD9615758.1 two-component system response regulator NarL [Pseudomonas sp. PDM07]NMN78199.1 LuxR family two component transcriptional regulator [Pseudomonas sp. KD5]QDV95231.1 two-component system response regulator NarL [Pseudomonas sp. ATCC 43928]UVM35372.1 two-component system response regulator NarL [Pseudomonas sp. B2
MTLSPQHKILLVDDHPMMRHGIRQMLELEDDFLIVGEASQGEEALSLIEPLQPDLVLLDNNMPQMNGIETLRRLRAMHYTGKVLLFTVSDAEDDIRDALRLDADGYLLKDMEPELLIQYIRDALNGALVISPGLTQVMAQALRAPARQAVVELTERERQVLKTIASGFSNKVIGHKLGITEGTVKVHVKNLLHKLGLRSRVEAAVWAMEHLRNAG